MAGVTDGWRPADVAAIAAPPKNAPLPACMVQGIEICHHDSLLVRRTIDTLASAITGKSNRGRRGRAADSDRRQHGIPRRPGRQKRGPRRAPEGGSRVGRGKTVIDLLHTITRRKQSNTDRNESGSGKPRAAHTAGRTSGRTSNPQWVGSYAGRQQLRRVAQAYSYRERTAEIIHDRRSGPIPVRASRSGAGRCGQERRHCRFGYVI